MRIREMTSMGLQTWPPQWLGACKQIIDDSAVLRGVKCILGTNLLRVDVEHNRIPYLGTVTVEAEVREYLYQTLKDNIGRSLGDITELELDPDWGRANSHGKTRRVSLRRLI